VPIAQSAPRDGAVVQSRTVARLALLGCGLAVALLVAALVLLWTSPSGPLPEGYGSKQEQTIRLLALLGPPLLGGVIVLRRPFNPYGWLWSGYALAEAVYRFTSAHVTYASASGTAELGPARLSAWVNDFAFVPVVGLLVLILLLFPDGRLPSPRWRLLAWTIGIIIPVTTILAALRPAGGTLGGVADFGVTALFFAVLLAAGSLVLRFRRARGQQRQQFKWLAYGAVFTAALLILGLVGQEPTRLVQVALEALSYAALYGGVAIAVLRYRLYDIDRLINRTLVYGLLTVLLAGVYGAAVLVLGQVFGGVSTDPPSWAVAGATLAVATLFQPARRRIQSVVDRRFNRRKYNAAKTVEAFSAHLRDEVDLDALTVELLAVADQTMQPTTLSLWLRPAPQAPPHGHWSES
jgi:hypothetical protein